MPPPKKAEHAPFKKRLNSEEVRILVRVVAVVGRIADRFGVAFAVFLVLFFFVWLLGSTSTKDDFIREIMFGSVTHTRQLSVFFVLLIITAVFGLDTWIRSHRTEGKEMRRLAKEKSEWQERALGQPLSHTEEGP